MSRHRLYGSLAAAGWLAAAGADAAQYPYPPGYGTGGTPGAARPPVSPYLNILQGTGNPAVNYYNFTRPALQGQQFYQQQQSFGLGPVEPFGLASRDVLYAPPGTGPSERMPSPTGHESVFMNTGRYFNR